MKEKRKKQNKKQTKTEKTRGREATEKEWELNDFVVHLSWFSPINM